MQQTPQQSEGAISEIHRFLAQDMRTASTPLPWYCRRGEIANLNAMLEIVDDSRFVDAAVWQLHGSDLSGRKR